MQYNAEDFAFSFARFDAARALKGQSHKNFLLQFFHQTAPPGPIRDILI